MKRVIDLSYLIKNGMPVFPGDPGVSFRQTASIANGGYNVTEITLGTHTGTHVDTPHHCTLDKRSVSDLSLDTLVGWAEVLDLGEVNPGKEIVAADLDKHASRVKEGARLILRTGWGKHWGKEDFFTGFPGITEGAATWLVNRKVKLVGIEQPSVHTSDHLAVHKILLISGVVLIETMANLDQITQDRVYLAALPINIAGGDGSPMRVVAIEGVDVLE